MSHNFTGAVQWFRDCQLDNSRQFWSSHRDRYLDDVRAPLVELLRSAGEDPDDWRIYKPHRDTRFSPDAPPLKEFLGALRVSDDGTGRYVQLDSRGLLASSGMPYLAADQIPRWRVAVDGAPGFEEALALATSRALTIKSGYPEPLKRVPRDFDPEHPRATYLRWKGIEAFARRADVDEVDDRWLPTAWSSGSELNRWLALHVGPSALRRP